MDPQGPEHLRDGEHGGGRLAVGQPDAPGAHAGRRLGDPVGARRAARRTSSVSRVSPRDETPTSTESASSSAARDSAMCTSVSATAGRPMRASFWQRSCAVSDDEPAP